MKRLLLVLLTLLITLSLFACDKVDIKLQKESFTYEYGEEISTDPSDYLSKEMNKEIIENTKIIIDKLDKVDGKEYVKVGTYKAVASYDGIEKDFTISVTDTVKPYFIDFKDELKTTVGTTDFYVAANYKAEDKVGSSTIPATISFDGNVDYKKAGSYKVTITATDENNNSISKEATIIVEEKKITTSSNGSQQSSNNKGTESSNNSSANIPSTPSNNGGNNSSSSGNSNGSSDSGSSSSSSSTPQVCVPGRWSGIGNSGFVTYSYDEAWDYAENNMPEGYGATIMSLYDSCGNEGWTVHWFEVTE